MNGKEIKKTLKSCACKLARYQDKCKSQGKKTNPQVVAYLKSTCKLIKSCEKDIEKLLKKLMKEPMKEPMDVK